MLLEEKKLTQKDLKEERFLMAWINRELKTDLHIIEQLCTGSAFCKLMNKMRPGLVDIQDIRFEPSPQHGHCHNYKLLEQALRRLGVPRDLIDVMMPPQRLMLMRRGHHRHLRGLASWLLCLMAVVLKTMNADEQELYATLQRRDDDGFVISPPEMRDFECQAVLDNDVKPLREIINDNETNCNVALAVNGSVVNFEGPVHVQL